MSGNPLCLLWFRDPQRPWYYRQNILSMSAMQVTSFYPSRIRWGGGGGLQSLPSSPLQPSSIYREWHWMTSPPPSTHTHTDVHKYAPMLREKIGWSNFWTPTQRFMAHWKQQGQHMRGRDTLSLMAREGVLFINIWESILACNKTARSISDCYSPPFCSINVSSRTS